MRPFVVRSVAALLVGVAVVAGIAPGDAQLGARTAVTPTAAQVARVLSESVEVAPGESARCKGPACERLHRTARTVVVADGHGGWLTAVPAVRWPTADGYGQVVLFWHDRTFIGSETLARLPSLGPEAASLAIVGSATNRIVIRFDRYRPSDAMCCPSLKPIEIAYSWNWNGRALQASAPLPASALLRGLAMVLQRF